MSRQVIRLSGNSTPGGQSVTSNGAGVSPDEGIIRLLFGDVCDRAEPFLKFEKTITWPPEIRGSVAVWFRLKTVVFGFGFKTVTAIVESIYSFHMYLLIRLIIMQCKCTADWTLNPLY